MKVLAAGSEAVLLHRRPADQVLLDDSLEHFLGAAVIPDLVGPDDRDGPCRTNLQAIGLGPLHAARSSEAELLEPSLEVFPRTLTDLAPAALALFGHAAKEDVPLDRLAADRRQRGFGFGNLL
jgi:hypothetical protein